MSGHMTLTHRGASLHRSSKKLTGRANIALGQARRRRRVASTENLRYYYELTLTPLGELVASAADGLNCQHDWALMVCPSKLNHKTCPVSSGIGY
jgi:hypothetical protein